MPPEPVTGFCILPRSATMASTASRTAVAVPAVLGGELPVGGGVQVERLHPDPHLVRPDLGAGVEPAGRLRQHTGGVQDPVQPDRGGRRGAWHGCSLRQAWYARSATLRAAGDPTASSGLAGVSCGVVVAVPQILPYPRDRPAPAGPRDSSVAGDRRLTEQPYAYRRTELVEPDWTRLPGLGRRRPPSSGPTRSGSGPTASRTSSSCATSWATCSRSASTPTSSATRPSGRRCRCWCRRRWSTRSSRPRTTAGRRRRPRSPTRSTPTRCAATCSRSSATAAPTGPRTRTRAATPCTSTRCGPPRG